MILTKTTDQVLLDAIQGLRDDIARLDRDQGDIRQANENLAMAVVGNTEQVKQFGKRLEIIETKIKHRVLEAIQPVIASSAALQESIDKKKFKILTEPFSWRNLLRRR